MPRFRDLFCLHTLRSTSAHLEFLARKDEFISAFAAVHRVPELVRKGFSIRPRFELEARTVELVEGKLQVVVALSLAMGWTAAANLSMN